MDSILTSIKKLLGIAEDYEHFDADIIIHINSVLMVLTQLGVGPVEGFVIEDDSATWNDFVPDTSPVKMSAIKTYVYLRVRLLFDPPNGTVISMINEQIAELGWRLNLSAESNPNDGSAPSNDSSYVMDYEKLKNLPSINGETLIGNYEEKDPTFNKEEIVNSVIEALPHGDEVKY